MKSAAEKKPPQLPPFLRMMTRYGGRSSRLLFWVCGIGLMYMGVHLGVTFFYLEGRALLFLPFLAQRVSLETLQKEPGRYNERWIRVEGLLWQRREAQALLVPVSSGPEPLTLGNAEAVVVPLPPVKLEVRHPYAKSSKTMDFNITDPKTTVELVGEFQAAPQARGHTNAQSPTQVGPELLAAGAIHPAQPIYWVPVGFRILIVLVFVGLSFPFMVLARSMGKKPEVEAQGPQRELLPRRISLSVLDAQSFLKRADKAYFQSAASFLQGQGFKPINFFTIPQLDIYAILTGFFHPQKRVYAAVYQSFCEDERGMLTEDLERWTELIATYPNGAQLTSTNQPSRELPSAQPPQRGLRCLPGAQIPDLWAAQLEAMAARKQRALPVSAAYFEMALIEAHILDHYWRHDKDRLSRAELLLIGRKLRHEGYEEYAEKIVEAMEKAAKRGAVDGAGTRRVE